MKISDIVALKISRIATVGIFWVPVIVFYFQYRGLNLDTTYLLISLYSIFIVVLEYPTGVIGDYFSHKLSVKLGYFLLSLSFFLMGFGGNMILYLITLFLVATGVSLVSGSDDAVLMDITENFSEDFKQIRIISTIFSIIATMLGGVLYKIYPPLPIFATGFCYLIAFLFMMFVKKEVRHDENRGNIFRKAWSSISFASGEITVRYIIVYIAIMSVFFVSALWLYNPLFESARIDETFFGLLISFFMLLNALGTRISGWFKFRGGRYIGFFLLLLVILAFSVGSLWLLIPMTILFIFWGVAQTQLEIQLNLGIPQGLRASVLSLRSLLERLFSALYLAGAGFALQHVGLRGFILITALMLFILFGINFVIMRVGLDRRIQEAK